MKKSLFITLCMLAIVVVSLLIGGCGSKNDENMDASYYRKILMLPDGQLLCSLEVEANKIDNAGRVFKVEKKDGKIRRITALYDGKIPSVKGKGWYLENTISAIKAPSSIYTPSVIGLSVIGFSVIDISEDGDDLVYTDNFSSDKPREILRLKNFVDGKPTVIYDGFHEYTLKYDNQGRCISSTFNSGRIDYSYTGDSLLPTGIIEYGDKGNKLNPEISLIDWDEQNRITKVVIKGFMIYDQKNREKFAGNEFVTASGDTCFNMAEMTQAFYEGDNPNPISVRAYTASGTPTRSRKTGVNEYAYRYDDKYNKISVEALVGKNVKDPVMAIQLGESKDDKQRYYCSSCRYAYDEKGRKIATAYYGKDGRPLNGPDGCAEFDLYISDDEAFGVTRYFNALGQPVNHKSIDKKIPAHYVAISTESKTHYFNTSGEWLGCSKSGDFSNSRFDKDSDLEKMAKESTQPIILGKMGLMQFVHEEKDVPGVTTKQTETSSTNTTVMLNSPLKAKDLTLGKLSIGDNTSTIRSAMGKPIEVVTENGQLHWKYHEIDITLVNDTISTLISNSPGAFTPRGIHEDSSIDDVFKNYGKDYRYEEYNNIQLYEYQITSKDSAACLLRFAVKKGENKVYYISMRKI